MIRMLTVIVPGVVILIMAALCTGSRAQTVTPDHYFVTQIAIDPHNTANIYALTTYSIGVLKSTDGGKDWTQANQGIRSYSIYQLTVHPLNPKILYLGAGGAGLYKSTDCGRTWAEMNHGLQNTDIGTLVLHPKNPDIVFIVTSTGVFKSPDGGTSWIALNQGDDFSESQQYQSLIVLPTSPTTLYLASRRGLYTRREGDAGWVAVPGILQNKKISALAYDPRTGRLYAGVVSRGQTMETLHEGGLFVSEDGGKSWARLGQGLEDDWIRTILVNPVDPKTMYVATSGRGLLKSHDGGKSWNEINTGLTDTDRDFRDLVMDPRDPTILYAGSHGHWIYQSRNAGATWTPLPLGPHQTAKEILADLAREDAEAQHSSPVHLPAVFGKCNQCHGWTDPHLNLHHGNWRVAANSRDWTPSVQRMSKGAGLTHEEEIQLADFLNKYTHGEPPRPTASPSGGPQSELPHESHISVRQHSEEDPVIAWNGQHDQVASQSNRNDPDNDGVYLSQINPDWAELNAGLAYDRSGTTGSVGRIVLRAP
jgi:photosystem II stability/assembly factor-like uncharacterized protein